MQAGNFIHVEDAVNAMMLALNSGKAASKTFNATGIKLNIERLEEAT